ncbi:MAG: hypothetical protein IKU68_07350 [Oscillospiraceae bacterium]|nr:hypothetical protein [Oscillospiraceae bacterium]
MRMPYEKPMMAIERYELTQTIASCATKIGFLDSDCVKNDPEATDQMKSFAWDGFFTEPGGCIEFAEGMDGFDSICYHTNVNAAFNS